MGVSICKFNILEKSQDWELEGMYSVIQFLSMILVSYLNTYFSLGKCLK